MSNAFFHRRAELANPDYYATPPKAVEELLQVERFSDSIWEPCCGGGHIAKVLLAHGFKVQASDLYNFGYGFSGIDFLRVPNAPKGADIITNPPYNQALSFVEHAVNIIEPGHKVAMFLRINFLETRSRRALFNRCPPKYVYVASSRFGCAPNGDFLVKPNGDLFYPSAVVYAWFIWEVGYSGDTTLRWFN